MSAGSISLVGQKFTRWLVLSEAGLCPKYRKMRYLCRCDCGGEKVIYGYSLIRGLSKSCGCICRERMKLVRLMKKEPDRIGMKFGRLTIIAAAGKSKPPRCARRYLCRCECGAERGLGIHHATRWKHHLMCGCRKRDLARAQMTTHGASKTTEFLIWQGMLRRCLKKSDPGYRHYGARGITVCPDWRESFHKFLADMGDMGHRPSKLHSIDRIDNNGNYCPENCRWATDKVQLRNKRNTVYLTAFGETMSLPDWADKIGVPQKILRDRLRYGWTHEKAVSVSVRPKKKRIRDPLMAQ